MLIYSKAPSDVLVTCWRFLMIKQFLQFSIKLLEKPLLSYALQIITMLVFCKYFVLLRMLQRQLPLIVPVPYHQGQYWIPANSLCMMNLLSMELLSEDCLCTEGQTPPRQKGRGKKTA